MPTPTDLVTVYNTLLTTLGAPNADAAVTVVLCQSKFGPGGTRGEYEVLSVPSWVHTNAEGYYAFTLPPNRDGTFYLVSEPGPAPSGTQHKIIVPTGGPFWLNTLLVEDPPVPPAVVGSVRYDAAQALTDAQKAQARENIGAGTGGGGGSGTVQSVNGEHPDSAGNVALTAAEVGAPAAPVVGPPAYYQFTSADVADGSSWWGAIPVHIIEWTPEVDGDLMILPPQFAPDDPITPGYRGDNLEVTLWRPTYQGAGHWQPGSGTPLPDVDYPSRAASSATYQGHNADWTGDVGAAPDTPANQNAGVRSVHAGVTYAITVTAYDGLLHKIDLSGIYASMYALGGLSGAQAPIPARFAKTLAESPGGVPCWKPNPFMPDTHTEGNNTHTEGYGTHAEGRNTHAEGNNTHAEGLTTHAEGINTHAEGQSTHAWRRAEHARGGYGDASQFVSHNAFPPVSGTSGIDAIQIPIYGPSGTHGRVTIMTATDRWTVDFVATNAATSFATRTSGAVSVGAQASSHIFGTNSVTWTVTGDSSGNVLITPSAACDRYHWVELWEFDPNPN